MLFSKHRRWNGKAYEVGLLYDILGLILESMGFESMVDGRDAKLRRPVKFSLKTRTFKDMCKLTLRYVESSCSPCFDERIPKSI